MAHCRGGALGPMYPEERRHLRCRSTRTTWRTGSLVVRSVRAHARRTATDRMGSSEESCRASNVRQNAGNVRGHSVQCRVPEILASDRPAPLGGERAGCGAIPSERSGGSEFSESLSLCSKEKNFSPRRQLSMPAGPGRARHDHLSPNLPMYGGSAAGRAACRAATIGALAPVVLHPQSVARRRPSARDISAHENRVPVAVLPS